MQFFIVFRSGKVDYPPMRRVDSLLFELRKCVDRLRTDMARLDRILIDVCRAYERKKKSQHVGSIKQRGKNEKKPKSNAELVMDVLRQSGNEGLKLKDIVKQLESQQINIKSKTVSAYLAKARKSKTVAKDHNRKWMVVV